MPAADFVVQPGIGLLVWTALGFVALPCAAITAAKGRWGWLLVGVVTLIGFIVGAAQPALEGSLWSRFRESRRS
jgi:hypothetical protein